MFLLPATSHESGKTYTRPTNPLPGPTKPTYSEVCVDRPTLREGSDSAALEELSRWASRAVPGGTTYYREVPPRSHLSTTERCPHGLTSVLQRGAPTVSPSDTPTLLHCSQLNMQAL